MKNQLFILLCSFLLLSSCHSFKWAEKGIIKRDYYHPSIVENICATRYKPIDSVRETIEYIQGATIIETDTLTLPCDPITKVVKVPGKTKIRVDTFYHGTESIQTNKALENSLRKAKDSALTEIVKKQQDISKFEQKIKTKNKQIAISYSIIGAIILGLIAYVYIKKF